MYCNLNKIVIILLYFIYEFTEIIIIVHLLVPVQVVNNYIIITKHIYIFLQGISGVKKKKKKKTAFYNYSELAAGYDENDSFIDNTEIVSMSFSNK